MRIQQRNVEKIHRRLNGYNKRQTGITQRRIRFDVVSKHIDIDGNDYIEEDPLGQISSNDLPFVRSDFHYLYPAVKRNGQCRDATREE